MNSLFQSQSMYEGVLNGTYGKESYNTQRSKQFQNINTFSHPQFSGESMHSQFVPSSILLAELRAKELEQKILMTQKHACGSQAVGVNSLLSTLR